ncbi:hypothetical protein BLNAU_969 [Blattamonas nauphoetae]|uniref:Uncharacterized protein n=1 Tax=Blattamonas nauphoetae TaxID=2049346 RepID=A0ABQ9YJF5_9EUKA|nr:hypothetical protein BLNAU_969 [Blattamonas nauphoetae]
MPTISKPLAAVFIPPNNLAVSWDNGRICVWHTETGVEKMTLRRLGEEKKKNLKNELDQKNNNPKSVPVLQSYSHQTSSSRPLTNQPTTPVLPTLARSPTTLGVCSACLISDPSHQDILITHTSDGIITIFSLSTRPINRVLCIRRSFCCWKGERSWAVVGIGRVIWRCDHLQLGKDSENEFGFSESAAQLKTSYPIHLQSNHNHPLQRWRWMDAEIAGIILPSQLAGALVLSGSTSGLILLADCYFARNTGSSSYDVATPFWLATQGESATLTRTTSNQPVTNLSERNQDLSVGKVSETI